MSDPEALEELVSHLARTSRLSPQEARHLVEEVLSFLTDTPENFVRRRHRALQAAGWANAGIYAQLAAELSHWRFRAPPYTERQIRRLIYG